MSRFLEAVKPMFKSGRVYLHLGEVKTVNRETRPYTKLI
ncbi:hypothetical protein MC7420_18 [Coleofasciculus chthonoplastes PCC 7420]|uniref:Uncharacterized protein n=1 Tax=Coleofasciculus chthonoplastes PCC 7420 TaxID=118168 RepID=B4W2X7_9CYAN|nr:hypothetical protein MC7420_18 [Coleofasciculus chthonoplastes PCC 7420]